MDVMVQGTLTQWWETMFVKVQFQPITEFELANRYKGTEDPHEGAQEEKG